MSSINQSFQTVSQFGKNKKNYVLTVTWLQWKSMGQTFNSHKDFHCKWISVNTLVCLFLQTEGLFTVLSKLMHYNVQQQSMYLILKSFITAIIALVRTMTTKNFKKLSFNGYIRKHSLFYQRLGTHFTPQMHLYLIFCVLNASNPTLAV